MRCAMEFFRTALRRGIYISMSYLAIIYLTIYLDRAGFIKMWSNLGALDKYLLLAHGVIFVMCFVQGIAVGYVSTWITYLLQRKNPFE